MELVRFALEVTSWERPYVSAVVLANAVTFLVLCIRGFSALNITFILLAALIAFGKVRTLARAGGEERARPALSRSLLKDIVLALAVSLYRWDDPSQSVFAILVCLIVASAASMLGDLWLILIALLAAFFFPLLVPLRARFSTERAAARARALLARIPRLPAIARRIEGAMDRNRRFLIDLKARVEARAVEPLRE